MKFSNWLLWKPWTASVERRRCSLLYGKDNLNKSIKTVFKMFNFLTPKKGSAVDNDDSFPNLQQRASSDSQSPVTSPKRVKLADKFPISDPNCPSPPTKNRDMDIADVHTRMKALAGFFFFFWYIHFTGEIRENSPRRVPETMLHHRPRPRSGDRMECFVHCQSIFPSRKKQM